MTDAPAMKVFISYSRKDRDFVANVVDALEQADGMEVFRDTDDILPTEEWQDRLEQLIREADTIVFALSPHSAKSEVCAWEVELAESLNKRFAPIVIRDVEGQDIPAALAKLNYIFFTNKREFDASIGNLIAALNTDIGWIREHTRLGNLARRWDLRGRPAINTLRGSDLTAAESWISSQPKNAPQPTALHHEFIQASRKTATKRQRMTVGGSLAAAVVAIALAGYAVVQQRAAESALRTGTESANKLVFGLAQKFKDAPVPGRIIESILNEARGLQEKLSANFPDNPDLQRSKANAIVELGDVYARLDNLSTAKAAYEESLKIARALERRDPENTQWQRDVALSLNKLGDIHLKAGEAEDALEAYRESLKIRRELAKLDPGNIQWQRDVSVGLNRVGDLRLRKGDANAALKAYEESLEIARELVRREPDVTQWQDDVSFCLSKIGDIRRDAGDADGAMKAFQEGLEIRRKLVRQNPENMLLQRVLSVSLERIGDLRRSAGDASGALEAYEEGLEIRRKLVRQDPENIQWQRTFSVSFDRIGDLRRKAGDASGALKAYEESLDIRRKLVSHDPENIQWQRDVSVSLNRVGNLRREAGNASGAMNAYEEALEIVRRLARLNPDSPQSQMDLVVSLYKIATTSSDIAEKRRSLKEALDIMEPLEANGLLTASQKSWPELFRKTFADLPAETAAQ